VETDEPPQAQEDDEDSAATAKPESPASAEPRISPEVAERIDALFRDAERDRGKAVELKAELDRRGLFRRYEDRFLDLFRRAG
jgi:uncharacterized protein